MKTQGGTWGIIDVTGELVGSAAFSNADDYGFALNGLEPTRDAGTGR